MRQYVPSERDLEIYYSVKGQQARQVELAAKFDISQPRVSAIIASVSQWLIDQQPAVNFALEERLYLAADAQVARLAEHDAKTRKAFELTCENRLNNGAIRPDARLLREGLASCNALYEATLASIHAAERCRTARSPVEASANEETVDATTEVLYENEPEAPASTPTTREQAEQSVELPSTCVPTPAPSPAENANHTTCYIPLPAEPKPVSRQQRRQQKRARARGHVRDWIADAFEENGGEPLLSHGSRRPERGALVP